MRLYLEYILSICRPSKIAARRQLRTGFTTTEVLLASLIMGIVAVIAIQGSINLMRSVYKANANSDQRDSLHRALNLMSNELRRAKIISTDIPAEWKEKNPILLFYLANPQDPTLTIDKPVVYFVKNSTLFRYGPPMTAQVYRDLDDTGKWQTTPVAFDFQSEITDASTQDCDIYRDDPKWSDKWERFPVSENNKLFVPGIYACIKKDTKSQVALVASTQAEDTTGQSLSLTLSTRVSSPAQNTPYMISNNGEDIPKFKIEGGGDVIRIITTKKTDIDTTNLGSGPTPTTPGSGPTPTTPGSGPTPTTPGSGPTPTTPGSDPKGDCQTDCKIESITENIDEGTSVAIGGTLPNVPAGADILVKVGGMTSIYGTTAFQKTVVYTINNPRPGRTLQSNQVLLSMTDLTASPPKEHLLLLTFK